MEYLWSSSIGRCKTNGHHPWEDVKQVVIIHSKDFKTSDLHPWEDVKQVVIIHSKM